MTRTFALLALLLAPALAHAQEDAPAEVEPIEAAPPAAEDATPPVEEPAVVVVDESTAAVTEAPAEAPGAAEHTAPAAPPVAAAAEAPRYLQVAPELRVIAGPTLRLPHGPTPGSGLPGRRIQDPAFGVDVAFEARWRVGNHTDVPVVSLWPSVSVGGSVIEGETIVRTLVGAGVVIRPRCKNEPQPFAIGLHLAGGLFFREVRAEATRWSWGFALQPAFELGWASDDAVFGGLRIASNVYVDFDKERDDVIAEIAFLGLYAGARL